MKDEKRFRCKLAQKKYEVDWEKTKDNPTLIYSRTEFHHDCLRLGIVCDGELKDMEYCPEWAACNMESRFPRYEWVDSETGKVKRLKKSA